MTPRYRRESGVVLLVSLLVLLLMGVIATTVASTNLLQLHMAGNDEARTAAMQRALAVIDAVFARPDNFSTQVSAGHKRCAQSGGAAGCDSYTLTLEQEALPTTGGMDVAVLRLAPQEVRMPVLAENSAHSTVHYRLARYEVQVTYEDVADAGGRAALVQGVLVRLSHSSNFGGGMP